MSDAAYLIAGFLAGAAMAGTAAWVVARASSGRAWQERAARAETEAASRGALIAELRSQSASRTEELAGLNAALARERAAAADAGARMDEARRAIAEQKELLQKMEAALTERFRAISLESLKSQNELGARELAGKKDLIDRSIEGMSRKLVEMQTRFEDLSKNSMERMRDVTTRMETHAEATLKLRETTDELRTTLASARKRGEWGERMAEDIIRLVGLIENVSYTKQKSLEHSAGRPDYTFMLPGGLRVNMDVKFPMDNYLRFLEAEDDARRKSCRDELMKNVRAMIKGITGREYINPKENTVDYVLMFIPNEQVYGFINEADVRLMDEALRQKVILCSPFTLYAVLAVMRQAIDNFKLERTASEILRVLSEFSKQWQNYRDAMDRMGKRLDDARKEYEHLVGTRTNVLERQLRKIDELSERERPLLAEAETCLLPDENPEGAA